MERAASEESGSSVDATVRVLDDVEILEERLGMVSVPHASEANIDQSQLLRTISRRYSHPDIRHFLQHQSDLSKFALTLLVRERDV